MPRIWMPLLALVACADSATPPPPVPAPAALAPALSAPNPRATCEMLRSQNPIPPLSERVYIDAIPIRDGARTIVVGVTNLVNGMEVALTLGDPVRDYPGEATVVSGCFVSGPFGGDQGIPLGRYDLEVGTLYASLYSPNVQEVIGDHGQRLRGAAVTRQGAETVVMWVKSVQVAPDQP